MSYRTLFILFVGSLGLGSLGLLAYFLSLLIETNIEFSKLQVIQFIILILAGLFFHSLWSREKK